MNDTIADTATAVDLPTEVTLQLLTPFEHATTEYTELQLSEPTAAQLVKAGKAGNQIEQLAALISLNAKVPRGAVDLIRQRDLGAAADFFARFSGESPPTLAMSSLS